MSLRTSITVALLCVACGKGAKGAKDQTDPTKDGKLAPGPVSPAARGPERAVYSLIDNRLAAHLTRGGGLVVPAGSAGFAKYVRIGNGLAGEKPAWRLRRLEGDAKVARIDDKTAALHVPLTAEQASRSTVRLRVHVPKGGRLKLAINGNAELDAKLYKGWSTLDVAVPAGQLKEGENAIELTTRDLAVEWIQIGATTPLGDADDAIAFYDPASASVVIPVGGKMAWHAIVPDQARLAADVPDRGCAVRVLATAEDGTTVEGKLSGTGDAVNLAKLAGKAARLELEAVGCPRVAVANAALVVPGARPPPPPSRGEPPKYMLFVIMDSLRADRVRAFDAGARAETPVLDNLAQSSSVFVNHYVQGNESQVSHAAIWTSMYLAKHRAPTWYENLPDKLTTLDDVAAKAGHYSVGATGNGYVRPSRGFGTSWNRFVNHIEAGLGLRADAIVASGLQHITPKKDQPWFLYLGLIDTHVTWRAKQPWIDRYDPGYKGRFAKEFGDEGPGGTGFPKDLTDREKEHVRAIYDSNVSYLDDQLGKLLAKLEAWGIRDQTMIVVTADHGDEQWEDGRVGHETGQTHTLLHVPLLVHYPPIFPAARIAQATEAIDILPTIADALGVDADTNWQGTSLVEVAHDTQRYPGLASSSEFEKSHGARLGHWKLCLAGTADPKLFDLAADRYETTDRYNTALVGGRTVLDPMWILRSFHVEWKKARWGNPANVSPRFAADLGE